ncbi:MAG: hypothetical protein KBE23_24905 [Chloroflexi bacterium]|nr:hypothetical protein [Chloroflexota bacterium]MBP7046007.1 hypothetical protein [Chloroflexota bacterium]
MMKTQGSFAFAAPPTDIWPFLINPQTLSHILPGCQGVTPQENGAYLAKLHIRLGPLAGEYAVTLQPADIQPQTAFTLAFSATSKTSGVQGHGRFHLESPNPTETILYYETQAEVSGDLQQFAAPLLETNARAITRQSLENLARLLQSRQPKLAAGQPALIPPTARAQQSFMPYAALATLAVIGLVIGLLIWQRRKK